MQHKGKYGDVYKIVMSEKSFDHLWVNYAFKQFYFVFSPGVKNLKYFNFTYFYKDDFSGFHNKLSAQIYG